MKLKDFPKYSLLALLHHAGVSQDIIKSILPYHIDDYQWWEPDATDALAVIHQFQEECLTNITITQATAATIFTPNEIDLVGALFDPVQWHIFRIDNTLIVYRPCNIPYLATMQELEVILDREDMENAIKSSRVQTKTR